VHSKGGAALGASRPPGTITLTLTHPFAGAHALVGPLVEDAARVLFAPLVRALEELVEPVAGGKTTVTRAEGWSCSDRADGGGASEQRPRTMFAGLKLASQRTAQTCCGHHRYSNPKQMSIPLFCGAMVF
jgi:hypothetical protein